MEQDGQDDKEQQPDACTDLWRRAAFCMAIILPEGVMEKTKCTFDLEPKACWPMKEDELATNKSRQLQSEEGSAVCKIILIRFLKSPLPSISLCKCWGVSANWTDLTARTSSFFNRRRLHKHQII